MSTVNRALKPYPPVNVAVTNSVGVGAVVTWFNRNRLTSGIKKQTDPTDTPESGQTVTISIYRDDGTTLLRTVTGLTGTTYTYTNASETTDAGSVIAALIFKVKSVRDVYSSSDAQVRLSRAANVIAGTDNVLVGTDQVTNY